MDGQLASTGMGFLLAVAAASDAAARRISNRLTVPLAAGALAMQLTAGGPMALLSALAAAAVVGAALWPPWHRGWLVVGDLKLAVAAGLWVGWRGLPA
jgi:prepilin peptidase CpaA